jgi:hypothetical protein
MNDWLLCSLRWPDWLLCSQRSRLEWFEHMAAALASRYDIPLVFRL